jgi:transposase-like protein
MRYQEPYTEDQKADALARYAETGSAPVVAREQGISLETIYRWLRARTPFGKRWRCECSPLHMQSGVVCAHCAAAAPSFEA